MGWQVASVAECWAISASRTSGDTVVVFKRRNEYDPMAIAYEVQQINNLDGGQTRALRTKSHSNNAWRKVISQGGNMLGMKLYLAFCQKSYPNSFSTWEIPIKP